MATSVDNHHVQTSGDVRGCFRRLLWSDASRYKLHFSCGYSIGNGEQASALVRLSGLGFQIGGMFINTDVDIPQGKQVVVGRATAGDRAFILVVSAKILN
jgi:hypothetical protein